MDTETLELKQKIEELNQTIDAFVTAIAVNDIRGKDDLYPVFLVQIQTVFPLIVQYYTRPAMQVYNEDLAAWSNQLSRIMDALKGKDVFFLVDVLRFEVKENLVYFLDIMK